MDDHTVVGRILDILQAVGCYPDIGLADLAATTGIPKSSAHRLAATLVQRGALVRAGHGYRLGGSITSLPSIGGHIVGLAAIRAVLDELLERFGGIAWFARTETATAPALAVATAEHRKYLARGLPDPTRGSGLTHTAMGQAVLAERPELLDRVAHGLGPDGATVVNKVRAGMERGVFFEDLSVREGWRCVAVPVAAPFRGVLRTGGVIGLTVRNERLPARELIAVARDCAEPLAMRR